MSGLAEKTLESKEIDLKLLENSIDKFKSTETEVVLEKDMIIKNKQDIRTVFDREYKKLKVNDYVFYKMKEEDDIKQATWIKVKIIFLHKDNESIIFDNEQTANYCVLGIHDIANFQYQMFVPIISNITMKLINYMCQDYKNIFLTLNL